MCLLRWASLAPLAISGYYYFRTGVSSASGTEMPPAPVLRQPCAFSSPFLSTLPPRPPTPYSQRPCAPLSLLVAHVFLQPCIPVLSFRCIPDVLCASYHLLSPSSSSLSRQELCVVPSPSHAMTITFLSHHYRALPHSLLQSRCWDPILPLHIYHVSSSAVAERPNPPVSPCAMLSFSSRQSPYALCMPSSTHCTSTSNQCTTELF